MLTRFEGNVIVVRSPKSKIDRVLSRASQLNTCRVDGYYYNTHARVTFENPSSFQAPDDERSLLNQRFWNYMHVWLLTNHNVTWIDKQGTSIPRMAKTSFKNKEEKLHQLQIPLLTHLTYQINLQEDACQLQNENEIMTKTNMTNHEEGCFNESIYNITKWQTRPTESH